MPRLHVKHGTDERALALLAQQRAVRCVGCCQVGLSSERVFVRQNSAQTRTAVLNILRTALGVVHLSEQIERHSSVCVWNLIAGGLGRTHGLEIMYQLRRYRRAIRAERANYIGGATNMGGTNASGINNATNL